MRFVRFDVNDTTTENLRASPVVEVEVVTKKREADGCTAEATMAAAARNEAVYSHHWKS